MPGSLACAARTQVGGWSALLAGSPLLHVALSLESVADEVIFVERLEELARSEAFCGCPFVDVRSRFEMTNTRLPRSHGGSSMR